MTSPFPLNPLRGLGRQQGTAFFPGVLCRFECFRTADKMKVRTVVPPQRSIPLGNEDTEELIEILGKYKGEGHLLSGGPVGG